VGNKESILGYTLQINDKDNAILKRELFNVPMELFERSESFRNIIIGALDYMGSLFSKNFNDYAELSGVSGANIGVPYNLIVVKNKATGKLIEMINPLVVGYSKETRKVRSNCGSVRLAEPVMVERYTTVTVAYYDGTGKRKIMDFEGQLGSTIQHEIDHNLGITILDRAVK
jgi:peptide deformylase